MLKEFKEFAVKGNAADMAVGIIIGAAFGRIVTSIVNDMIMPPIGLLLGGVDFGKLHIVLKAASGDSAAVAISYGKFIQTGVDFVIVAFVMFLLVKSMNTLKRKADQPKTAPSNEAVLLAEIRDILRERR